MIGLALGLALAVELPQLDPLQLVRVDDPDHPDALARSAHGAVLSAPPETGDWRWETVPQTDGWPARVALEAVNADLWHAAGFRGQGARVAVFDIQWFGSEVDPTILGEVTTADCWAHPSCDLAMDNFRARFGFEEGTHGYACAQIVHDLAPEAELFAVRVNGFLTFESAVDWAIRNDIDVISMSMSFFNGSFYDGSGQFEPVMRRLEQAGVLLVTSAGNYAGEHWDGAWRDGDADGRLDFDGSNGLDIVLSGTGRRTVFVNWNEHYRCGNSDLDAYVYSPDGDLVGRSEALQDPEGRQCSPVERVAAQVDEDGVYRLEVHQRRLVRSGLHIDVLATSGSIPRGVRTSSMADPAPDPWAFVVGAVRADGYLHNNIEGFSSLGPGRGPIPKPDIAGPDGLSAYAYGPQGFFGTSAATPAVAGTLALVMSRYPQLSAREASQRLKGWALTDNALPHDPRWGAGKARLPVPEATDTPCGRRPLWAGLFLPPVLWWRRRRSAFRPGPAHRRARPVRVPRR